MISYRVFLGALFVITSLNLVLFLQQRASRVPLGESGAPHSSIWVDPTYRLLRELNDDRLFVLEPYMLVKAIGPKRFRELQWRFDLPEFSPNSGTVTLGIFGNEALLRLADRPDLTEVARTEGPHPFTNETVVQHLFYTWQQDLRVHVVVLHPVKHFLWIGQITKPQLLSDFNVHFGKHEEIYDKFNLARIDSIQFPDSMEHFLGQMPTSRYMHCDPEKQNWLQKYNIKYNKNREDITVESIVAIKSLMRELQMEFWCMCGTLLGWYRQCGPIPFTTDNDFSTWPKYLRGKDIAPLLKETAPKHNLKLFYRFGEPWHSMEYSFKTGQNRDKVDLFFSYHNETNFLIPFHIAWKHVWQYSVYPVYNLCSIELLGYKLLAPCQTEAVIRTEYGPNWDRPKEKYDYAESPFNSGPKYNFPRNITQYTEY